VSTELPGASSLDRVDICPSSEAYPHFEMAPHEWTKLGDAMHAFLEAAYNAGREAALEWAFDKHPHLFEAFELVPLDRLPPFDVSKWQPEVSFAYNPFTKKSRVLGHSLNRNVAREMGEPDEIVFTGDLVGVEDDACLLVDWKTGHKLVAPPERNWQIKTGILGACRAKGLVRGRAAIIRVLLNGMVLPWEWYEMDEDDLNAHEAALRGLLRRRAKTMEAKKKGEPLPYPLMVGPQCDYCPARLSCPAWLGLARATCNIDEDRLLSGEELGRGWEILQQKKKAIELSEAWFKATARQSPISLPSGDLLGERLVPKESIIPDMAKPVLAKRYGEAVAEAVLGDSLKEATSLPKDRFKSALKRHVLPRLEGKAKIGQLERDVYEALRQGRAVTIKMEKLVKTYRPRPGAELPAAEESEEAA